MHITRQIAMTVLPSFTSKVIARKILSDVLNHDLSFTGRPGDQLRKEISAAAEYSGGLKSFAVDVLSLPTRLVVGVDKQAKNVPTYHEGYFLSAVPKPLPGVIQAAVAVTRGLAFLSGYGVGAAGSVVGTLVGKTAQFFGSTRAPADVAAACGAGGMAVGATPFAAMALALELFPKVHRKLLDALIA